MDLLQNTDGSTLLIAAVGCCLLCGVGVVLLLLTQLLGSVFDIFSSVFGLVFNVVEGGPVSWCGCLALIGVGLVCGGLVLVLAQALSTCGTPNAVNFCRLLGG